MWDCAKAALPARSKSWEEVLKNDLGGPAPWAGSVPFFFLYFCPAFQLGSMSCGLGLKFYTL